MKRADKTHINQRGFTMIEMVLVFITMAIVGAVIMSRATMNDNELLAQADILKSHLRHAQIKAMNDTLPWGIRVPNAGSYILYRNNVVAKDNSGNDIILPGEVSPAPQTHNLPTAVTITAGTGMTYNFDNWGSPGTSTLTITLAQGTATSTITITRNTGYIP